MESRKRGVLAAVLALGLILAASPAHAAKSKTAKVDLNNATQAELETLPGVGAATAQKIIAGRPYKKVSDLEKAGVSASTIDQISKLVKVGKPAKAAGAPKEKEKSASSSGSSKSTKTAESTKKTTSEQATASKSHAASSPAGPIDLNTASQKDLESLPGVGEATAKKIIAGRPFASVADLSRAGVSASTIDKISPLVTVSGSSASKKSKMASEASSSAPAAAPAAGRSQGSTAAASSSASEPEAAAYRPPPARGMVWVNTATKVYHYEGDQWYGKTKEGKYMTEKDAIAAGYHASKQKVSGNN